ncbi:MAG: glycoside hydrolase family 13 protein [Spirosomaceae bacterium]|jgi:glycosidase|nr:glycoside hydrolase family 13 protein [Spirosomataceae bacterium]
MKLTKQLLILILVQFGIVCTVYSQKPQITRIDPTNWYVGMKNPNLQVLVYGIKIAKSNFTLKPYSGVKLKKIQKVENPNYLFIDLEISKSAKAGSLEFVFAEGNSKNTIKYELKNRSAKPQGVDQSDFIYLLMPDRFANGDESNDKFDDLNDKQADKNNPFLRHGGDLKGITDRLDYLKELGVTAVWMTPVIENNTELTDEGGTWRSSYHGYHFTDFYQIDKRFGGNEGYKKFVNDAHAKGIKVVQDAVYNHIGLTTWFYKDLPSKDWINQWDTYTNTSYKEQSIVDPNGSAYDRKICSDGWFTKFLPDLNQRNPFLANYLIQNAVWITENFGIDAWRIDTYMYNDLAFMNRCNKALMDEFPKIHLFGESWVRSVFNQAYFTKNNINFPFKCNLPGTLDFMVQTGILDGLNQNYDWDGGVQKLYQILAQDGAYQDASKNVTFLDNHDTDRYFSVVGEDFDKYKMGITWLLTLRGIPHFYYGTEILMKNFKNPSDAEVRKDFPGGFKGDSENKFTKQGRNAKENEAFDFVSKLANYRKNSEALTKGKFLQFVPFEGIYVYFRYTNNQRVMIISNTNKEEKIVETARFNEILKGSKSAQNVLNGTNLNDISKITIPAKTSWVLEVK